MPQATLVVECLKCSEVFPGSPSEETGDGLIEALLGNQLQCPHCRQLTGCGPENMFYQDRAGELRPVRE